VTSALPINIGTSKEREPEPFTAKGFNRFYFFNRTTVSLNIFMCSRDYQGKNKKRYEGLSLPA
jgi:hypothetical protein